MATFGPLHPDGHTSRIRNRAPNTVSAYYDLQFPLHIQSEESVWLENVEEISGSQEVHFVQSCSSSVVRFNA